MLLRYRIAIFVLLWLVAGAVCATFVELRFEAGEGEDSVSERLVFVYLVPIICAFGVVGAADALVRDHLGGWHVPDACFFVLVGVLLVGFVIHAIVTLTRKSRHQFQFCSVIQAGFLTISVACVLYFYYYEARHSGG
jgi:hypothetical protein